MTFEELKGKFSGFGAGAAKEFTTKHSPWQISSHILGKKSWDFS